MAEAIQPSELEKELSFLPTRIPEEIQGLAPKRVTDIYLSSDSDLLTKLRLRQNGSRFELTKKVVTDPNDPTTQQEYTVPLTEAEFSLFRQMPGRVVEKDRFETKISGYSAEVDVFRGSLSGLVVVEFEFDGEAEMNAFVAPEICGADVSTEDFIAGAYLAGRTYSDIAPELARFNYQPLELAA